MGRPITKDNLTKIPLLDRIYDGGLKEEYQETIMSDQAFVPKKLEYDDIDSAMREFVENELRVEVDGVVFPTFSLFSNQRFTEYSQIWEHTDKEGNMKMNFKTVIRDTNPEFGNNQGGNYAIPGDRKYTVLIRDVLDDNGIECHEVYTMRQPMTVTLKYRINIFTDLFSNINTFNMKVNSLFKARQFYIKPNGHYVPLLLDGISDETTYGVDERKFFTQSYSITAEAYIIRQEDIEVMRAPKRMSVRTYPDVKDRKANVEVDEDSDGITLMFTFPKGTNNIEFSSDFGFRCVELRTANVRRVKTDLGEGYFDITDGKENLSFKKGGDVRLKVIPLSANCMSEVVRRGVPLDDCE